MEVRSLSLKNFRNYAEEHIEFAPRTNLIYGDNAQGKTNILEAVYMAANGRSHQFHRLILSDDFLFECLLQPRYFI